MNMPDISIPRSGKSSASRMQSCGGMPRCRTGDGTMKHSGFKGRSGNGSGSQGQVGPGTGFQGSKVKGTRTGGCMPPKMTSMGFTERG